MSTQEKSGDSPRQETSVFNPYDGVPILAVALMLIGYLMYRGAAPHGVRQLWGKEILMPLGNFLLFGYLLLSKAIPALKQHLQNRHKEIAEGLQDFAQSSNNIADRFSEVKQKLAHVEAETASIIERAKTQATTEKETSFETTKAQAERIRNSADTLTQYEHHRIQKELQQRLMDRAFDRAQELLVEHIKGDDQQRLQREYLTQLEKIS